MNAEDNNSSEANKLWNAAVAILGEGGAVTALNISDVCVRLMREAQQLFAGTGRGEDKHAAVVRVLRKLIVSTVPDDIEQRAMLLLTDTVVPGIIESAVRVARGEIDLMKQVPSACLSGCLAFWSRRP